MVYPNYSVLSCVYIKEKPEYLRRSIESMINQTIPTNDYVIVRDGPITKELQDVLDEYEKLYPYIHVCGYDVNKGLGYALNYGLEKCKNELVARMDTDDISLPNRCQRELLEFINCNELEIVGTSIMEFVGEESNIVSVKKMPENKEDIRKYARRRNPFNHPTVMYKKSSVIKYGKYQEGQRGEDIGLFTKMVFKGCVCKNINDELFMYRADKNQFRRRSSLVDSKAVIKVAKRNYGSKYIGFNDYLFVVISQSAGMILPKQIGAHLFKKMFRNSYEK